MHARRHRRAQPALRVVAEPVVHLDVVLDGRARAAPVAVVERLPVDDVALLDRHAGAVEQRELLGLAGWRSSSGGRACRGGTRRTPPAPWRAAAARRIGHHLQLLLAGGGRTRLRSPATNCSFASRERRAAAVGQRHPAVEVRGLVVAAHGQHVVRLPGEAAGEIGRFDAVARAAAVGELPDQRGPAVQIGRAVPGTGGGRRGGPVTISSPIFQIGAVVVADERRLHLLLLRSCRFPCACGSASPRGRRTCAAACRARAGRTRSSARGR